MRAIAVTCPHCGATLRVDGDLAAVTCSYCGTTARVQQRTRVFQVPRPPMPYPGPTNLPVPVARQKVSPVVFVVPMVLAGSAVAGGMFFARTATRQAEQAVEQAVQQQVKAEAVRKATATWWAEAPLVGDADGDGSDDLIGLVRYAADGDRAHLAAFSGKTGAPIWESPTLGTGAELTQLGLARAGDRVVVATEGGVLNAYGLRDGAAGWSLPMDEKISTICAGPAAGELTVQTADRKWWDVGADGARRPGKALLLLYTPGHKPKDALPRFRAIGAEGAPPGTCMPADNNGWHRPVGVVTIDSWASLPDIAGMSIQRLVRLPGGPIAAVGYKQPGTAVPMVAALDGSKTRWALEVPTSEPLTATADDKEVGMSAGALYRVYTVGKPAVRRLAAFAMTDGTRLWDVAMEEGRGSLNIVGVMGVADVVAVATWSGVFAYDQATGALRYTIGGS